VAANGEVVNDRSSLVEQPAPYRLTVLRGIPRGCAFATARWRGVRHLIRRTFRRFLVPLTRSVARLDVIHALATGSIRSRRCLFVLTLGHCAFLDSPSPFSTCRIGKCYLPTANTSLCSATVQLSSPPYRCRSTQRRV
jgi:hypothetical protein